MSTEITVWSTEMLLVEACRCDVPFVWCLNLRTVMEVIDFRQFLQFSGLYRKTFHLRVHDSFELSSGLFCVL